MLDTIGHCCERANQAFPFGDSPDVYGLRLSVSGGAGTVALAWKRPGLPTQWTRVLERNPEAMNPALPGYVWLDTPGKVLHVPEAHLEFRS